MTNAHAAGSPWNRTAVPVGAAMFLVAEIAVYALFMNPRLSSALVVAWFVVAFLVQFWGSRADRVVALAALVLMSVALCLMVALGG